MPVVEIPLNRYGLTGEQDASKVRTGYLELAENADFATAGRALQKDGGTLKKNASAIASGNDILAGTDYWATATAQRSVVYGSNGVLLKDDGSNTYSTSLKTGLTANRLGMFLSCGEELAGNDAKLIFFNGADAPQVLTADGSSTTNLASPPTEWTGSNQPSFGFLFRNSVIAGGAANDHNRIYASLQEDHEDFTTAGTYSILAYPGLGLKLAAGISALGRGYLFKYPNGILAIDDSSEDSADWHTTVITPEYGIPDSPHMVIGMQESAIAFLLHNGDVMLMQESGGTLTGIQFTNLTKSLNLREFVQTNCDLSQLSKSQMFWYADKNQLHITYASENSLVQDIRMIYDFNYDTVRASVVTKDIQQSIWGELDSSFTYRPIIGDDIGFVRRLDQETRTADGTPYQLDIKTYANDFSDVNPEFAAKKLFHKLHLEYIPTGDYNLPIEIFVDDKSYGTVQFNMAATGVTHQFRRYREIAGEGYTFAARITEDTANNPKIGRMWVEFDLTTMVR